MSKNYIALRIGKLSIWNGALSKGIQFEQTPGTGRGTDLHYYDIAFAIAQPALVMLMQLHDMKSWAGRVIKWRSVTHRGSILIFPLCWDRVCREGHCYRSFLRGAATCRSTVYGCHAWSAVPTLAPPVHSKFSVSLRWSARHPDITCLIYILRGAHRVTCRSLFRWRRLVISRLR